MPFRIETDPTLRRACGTDGPAWASAYMANQTKFDGDARHIELAAWFDAAIAAGRGHEREGMVNWLEYCASLEEQAERPIPQDAEGLPSNDDQPEHRRPHD